MNKKLLCFFLIICFGSSGIKAQDTLSHWSVGVKAGFDYYRVTPVSSKTGLSNYIDDMGWTFPGIFIEYTINPLVGFGASADYLNFDRNVASGHTFDFTVFGSANLTNLLSPRRTGFWRKVNVYGDWGGGLGYYSNKVLATGAKHSLASPLVTSALNMEYNLSKVWALRAETQYRYYFREDIGGTNIIGQTGTGEMVLGADAFVATIGLRYKLGATAKRHVRNTSLGEYYNLEERHGKDTLSVQSRLKALETDGIASKDKLQKLETDLKAITDENRANKEKIRMLEDELKAIPQTQVLSQTEKNAEDMDKIVVLLDVNFKSGSARLQPEAKTLLDQVTLVLKVNKKWSKLEVVGYTDNIGRTKMNQKLSQKRANEVKKYLVSKGIAASYISIAGFGHKNPKMSNATKEGRYKNRRAELVITK
jgi:OOP family OmpA-OmpF porin